MEDTKRIDEGDLENVSGGRERILPYKKGYNVTSNICVKCKITDYHTCKHYQNKPRICQKAK